MGDFILTRPTYFMSKEIALWSSENHVCSYICNYSSITSSKFYPNLSKWAGVTHGTELTFVFGNPLRLPQNFTSEEYQLSLLTTSLWTNYKNWVNPYG